MKPRIDLDELVGLVDLPDRLFVWSLDTVSGEVLPGADDSGRVVPLPQAQKEWMDFLDQKRRVVLLDWLSSLGLSLIGLARTAEQAALKPPTARRPGE